MRVAVIGGGIAGLVAAYRLHPDCDVTLFEANDYVGGHTNTVSVPTADRAIDPRQRGRCSATVAGGRQDQTLEIDTGFIVYNDRTYPLFCGLLAELGVVSQPTEMSFSVHCEATGLEYCGSSLNGLFAQRRNLANPRFLRLLYDFARFGRQALRLLAGDEDELTVGEYLRRERYSQSFTDHYFLPMGSAIWSCPRQAFANFPIRFIVEFYHNHGLLTVGNRPQWRVIRGGSRRYVEAMTQRFADRIRLRTAVSGVSRRDGFVEVRLRSGESEAFDHVVVACHSDQALRLLGRGALRVERELLGKFPYERNSAILHTDESVLPQRRRAWASWNYRIDPRTGDRATLSYNMNILQRLDTDQTYCVTLNDHRLDAGKVLREFVYDHPVFTVGRRAAQRRHGEMIDLDGISYCGAYWGNGFHEDGVRSATAVCDVLQDRLRRGDVKNRASDSSRKSVDSGVSGVARRMTQGAPV